MVNNFESFIIHEQIVKIGKLWKNKLKDKRLNDDVIYQSADIIYILIKFIN
jgi:hypothetical protein